MIIDSPIISGSYLSTGSLSQTGNVSITGSLTVTDGISGSFSGSGADLFGIPATGITGLNLSQISSGSVSASISPNQGLLINTSVSASNFTGSFTGSLTGIATSASYAAFALTSSYSLGGSGFPFSGSAVITGSLIVSGSGLTITGSVAISTLTTGSGVRYVIADQNGLLSAQTASAAIFTTQQVTSTAGQTTFPITNGYATGYVTVFVNGTKLSADEYVDTSGTNIIFLTGSNAGDNVEFQKYLPAAGVSNNTLRSTNYFTATTGQTNFSVNYTPGLIDIFYNGAKLDNTEYTAANGTSITLATASAAGDRLEVDVYSYQVGAFSGIGGTGAANQLAYFNTSNSITGSNAFTVSGSAVIITGSLIVSGSGTLINIGPAVFSGSVTSTAGFSGSFSGNADSASLAQNSLLLQGTGSIGFATTASLLAVSSSQQQISASLLNVLANYATTGSNSFRANQSITGSLVVSSTITAQTLVVQTVTSSIVYSSGSNLFGSALGDRQTFTGSIQASGSSSHFLMGGSVGIGITNPTRPLQINAAADTRLVITDSNVSTTAGLYIRQFGSASAIVNNSNGTFQLATNDTYFLTANTSGQVGIGTTQPSFILDVNDTNGSGGRGIRVSTSSTSVGPALFLYSNAGTYTNWVVGTSYSTTNALEFVSSNSVGGNPSSAGTTRMLITSAGSVIVGNAGYQGVTTDLSITGDKVNSNGYYSRLIFQNSNQSGGSSASIRGERALSNYATELTFYTNINTSAGEGSERMRIRYDGNVGIGTTNPAKPLSVWPSGGIGVYSNNTYSPSISLDFNSGTNIGHLLADQNAYYIRTLTSYPIYVQANQANGVYLSVGSTSWTANSDERLKNITSNIENAIDSLLTLRAIKHTWKSDNTNKQHLALIAQDVEKVFPEVIDSLKLPSKVGEEQTDETEYLGVRYTELIPVLVKAIQEQNVLIQELQEKLQRNNIN